MEEKGPDEAEWPSPHLIEAQRMRFFLQAKGRRKCCTKDTQEQRGAFTQKAQESLGHRSQLVFCCPLESVRLLVWNTWQWQNMSYKSQAASYLHQGDCCPSHSVGNSQYIGSNYDQVTIFRSMRNDYSLRKLCMFCFTKQVIKYSPPPTHLLSHRDFQCIKVKCPVNVQNPWIESNPLLLHSTADSTPKGTCFSSL